MGGIWSYHQTTLLLSQVTIRYHMDRIKVEDGQKEEFLTLFKIH